MASVRKQSSAGTTFYKAVWAVYVDGKRVQRSKSFERKADARDYARQMEEVAERRGVGNHQRQTVRQFFDYWLANHPKTLSPTTRSGYWRNLAFLASHVGDLPLDRLSALDLDKAYAALLKSGGRTRGRVKAGEARAADRLRRAPCCTSTAPDTRPPPAGHEMGPDCRQSVRPGDAADPGPVAGALRR